MAKDSGWYEENMTYEYDGSTVLSRRAFGGLSLSVLAALPLGKLSNIATAKVEVEEPESISYEVEGLKKHAKILVDKWGVPHMYADDIEDISFVQGFNAARDRLWQIDLWRRRGLGKLSEALGDEWIEYDRAARLFAYRGDIDKEWAAYGPDAEDIATGFAEGINAFIDQTEKDSDMLPVEFKALDYKPMRLDPEDIVRMRTHAITLNVSSEVERAITLRKFGKDVERVRQWLNPEDWEIKIPEGLNIDLIPEDVLDVFDRATMSSTAISFDEDDIRNPEAIEDLSSIKNSSNGSADNSTTINKYDDLGYELPTASNNWVVAPELTETGRPILANDPHRTHNVPSLRYIAHICAPEFDVIGAGEPGLPGISIGHNGHTAFGLTIFYIDQQDLYVYETNPDNPSEYKYEDQWVPMEVETESLEVRDGKCREIELKFTKHGPVIYEDPDENIAFAVRTVWTEPGTTAYFGSTGYMGAENIDEFEAAMNGELETGMKGWGTPPENQVAADTEGNIGWFPGGKTPVRPNWDGLLPVPGDGTYEWNGFLDQSKLPSEVNPDRGWIATANQFNLPENYPVGDPPIGFEWVAPYRYKRIKEILSQLDKDNKYSVEDSTDLQTDFLSPPMRIITEALAETDPNQDRLVKAREWLTEWDDVLDADSGEAALAQVWFENHLQEAITLKLVGEEASDHIGTADLRVILEAIKEPKEHFEEEPVATRNELLLLTLDDAIQEVEELLGDNWDEWEWGDLKKAFFDHALSAAVSDEDIESLDVGPIPMGGSGNTVWSADYNDDFQLTSGSSWRMVVDVGEWGNTLAMNVPGQSGDPESPFYDNLLDMFVNREYFPLLYERADIEDASVKRINLEPTS